MFIIYYIVSIVLEIAVQLIRIVYSLLIPPCFRSDVAGQHCYYKLSAQAADLRIMYGRSLLLLLALKLQTQFEWLYSSFTGHKNTVFYDEIIFAKLLWSEESSNHNSMDTNTFCRPLWFASQLRSQYVISELRDILKAI